MPSQRWTLNGQRALVTGASAVIGLAICRELLGLGAQVLMVARDADALEQARADLEDEFPGPENQNTFPLVDGDLMAEIGRRCEHPQSAPGLFSLDVPFSS